MSASHFQAQDRSASVECELARTKNYVERLRMRCIPAVPGGVDLMITAQTLGAQGQTEHVLHRCTVDIDQLHSVCEALATFVEAVRTQSGAAPSLRDSASAATPVGHAGVPIETVRRT